MASIRTSPSVAERLTTRTKLSRWGFDADTTNETACTAAAASENSNTVPIPTAAAIVRAPTSASILRKRFSLHGCAGRRPRPAIPRRIRGP